MTSSPAVQLHCQRTAAGSDTIVRAALERWRDLVHEAVDLDPIVLYEPASHRAVDTCLAARAEILPAYE